MEIEYSNFELDSTIFGRNNIVGLVDINSTFIYNRIYDIKKVSYHSNYRVKTFLALDKIKNKRLVGILSDGFEIDRDTLQKKMSVLSTGELIKVLTMKLCLGKAKVIILDHIDSYLNSRELSDLFKTIKNNMDLINKTIIFSTNKVDNIINDCDIYIIASENRIIYNGDKVKSLPIKTSVADFVDRANKFGAKLDYYKDSNDLLKAIYRSVKK